MTKYLTRLLIVCAALGVGVLIKPWLAQRGVAGVVYAEAEDREDEDNEDEDAREEEERDADYVSTQEADPPAQTTVAVQAAPVYVLEAGYTMDSDQDGLVDALDPNPMIPQPALFTDSDGDSVPDAFDKFPAADDFTYAQDADTNTNGILDSYE
jgi:hypothetical protein